MGEPVVSTVLGELRALVRALPLAIAAPRIVRQASRRSAEFRQAFRNSVQPHVDAAIPDEEQRARLTDSLLSYATKSAFVLRGYTTMAGIPFPADIAMLGLAFTRLYDDLLDDTGGPDLAHRLGDLITHGRFTPASDQERLLARLYRALDDRTSRDRDDPLYAAAAAAHRFQTRSTAQRDPATTPATLRSITRGKGRYGTLTVFALMRQNLPSRERALIMTVGEALQMLDDYADRDADRRAGVRTLATEGHLVLGDVARLLHHVRPHLAAHYGRRAIREFVGVCYLTMVICFLNRRLRRHGSWWRVRPSAVPVERPGHADDVLPRAETSVGP